MSTEEDGVAEAGRTTQSPPIMAPPDPKADPDELAENTVADNGIMAPSRARTGNSRSGSVRRASEGDGSTASGENSPRSSPAVTEELPVAEEAAEAERSTAVPLPADTIGETKVRTSSGEAADKKQDSRGQGGEEAMTSGESSDPATSAVPAKDTASTAKPPFRPSETAAAPIPHSSYSGPAHSDSASYAHSEWSTDYEAGNGFRSGAGPVAGGAPAGAGATNSAWQKRGGSAPRGFQVRKSNRRQAMLSLARVEPWSVMKFSFVASVVAFVILFVAVAVLYMVLAALGVFDSLQHTVSSVTSGQGTSGTNISHWFSASLILGYTAMLGALNIVLITAISTVGSVIYNLIAKTVGGIEVTLRETD